MTLRLLIILGPETLDGQRSNTFRTLGFYWVLHRTRGVAAVLSKSVLDQNGPDDHFGQTALFQTGVWHYRDQNGPKWSILVHLGPPTVLWSFLKNRWPRDSQRESRRFARILGVPRPSLKIVTNSGRLVAISC